MDEEKKEEVVSKEEVVETPAEVKVEEKKTEEVKTENTAAEPKAEEKKDAKDEQPKIENISSKKGKGNKLPLILGIVAILLLAIAGIAFYLINSSSSAEKIFKAYIDGYKDVVLETESLEGVKVVKAGTTLDVDLKLTDGLIDKDLLNLINDLKLDMDVQVDIEKNQMAYLITANKGEDKLLDLEAYLADKKMYAKLNDLFDKMLYTEVEDAEELNIDYSALTDNEKVVIAKVMDALSNSLKPEFFAEEKIDKEKKNILTLDDAKMKAMITSIATELKNDAEFITAASKLAETEEAELKSALDMVISEINSEEILPEGQMIQISLYTKGMKNDLTRVVVELKDNTTTALALTMNVVSDEEINYEISMAGQKITGTMIYKEKSKEEVDLTFTLKYGDYIDAKIMMTSTASMDKSNNIVLPDFSSAVAIEDLDEDDLQEIKDNAEKNEALSDVIDMLSGMIEDSMGSFDDYDEDISIDLDEDDFIIDEDEDADDEDEKSDNDKITVDENVVQYDKHKVTFKIPADYILDEEYSSNQYKYFDYDSKKEEIEVYLKITYDTAEEYFEDVNKWDYEYKVDDTFYSNVQKTDIKEKKIGNNTIKYVKITYNAGSSSKYEEIYAIYELDDEFAYVVEIEARNTSIPNKVFENFLDITVK